MSTEELLNHKPCLVLLGEPGMGKSQEMAGGFNAQTRLLHEDDGQKLASNWVHLVDLKTIRSYDRLKDRLLLAPEITDWKNSDYQLDLFIDSLDECRLAIAELTEILIEHLKEWPLNRLRLRIACRAAEWPKTLENELNRLFKEPNVGVYMLAPLTEGDVELAVVANGLDLDLFWSKVRAAGAVSLTSRPVTLSFLIAVALRGNGFEGGNGHLFGEGCLMLCSNSSDDPRMGPRRLTPQQRLVIASRIAALCVFTNRYVILDGYLTGNTLEGCLALADIAQGTEEVSGNTFPVTEAAVRETLDTGLFTIGQGDNDTIMWAHQTYAEYLAARYVQTRSWHDRSVVGLLFGSNADDAALVPQLSETAIWIALDRPEILSRILRHTPEVLLGSDVALTDSGTCSLLVGRLLEAAAAGEVFPQRLDYRGLERLNHPGIAEQLRPYFVATERREKDHASRWLAIDIAENSRVIQVLDDLAVMVLDESEELFLRVQAGYAISRMGDMATKEKLRPLIERDWQDDQKDELRGIVLTCLWPDSLSAAELFSLLIQPKYGSFFGAYKGFLYKLVSAIENLDALGVRIGLEWVLLNIEPRRIRPGLERLEGICEAVCERAWQFWREPDVLKGLAEIGYGRIRNYKDPLVGLNQTEDRALWHSDADKARNFFIILIERGSQDGKFYTLEYDTSLLVMPRDFTWLIQRYEMADGVLKYGYIEAINAYARVDDPDVLMLLWEACARNAALYERCHYQFDPVAMNSESADQFRKSYELQTTRQAKSDEETITDEDNREFASLVAEAIRKQEESEVSGWWQFDKHFLTVTKLALHGRCYRDETTLSLSDQLVWTLADDTQRATVLMLAKSYVVEFVPDNKWVGASNVWYPAFAACRAFILLREAAPTEYASLSVETWSKWIPTLLYAAAFDLVSGRERLIGVMQDGYRAAPEEFCENVLADMRRVSPNSQEWKPLGVVRKLWDRPLLESVLATLPDLPLTPWGIGNIYSIVLDSIINAGEYTDLYHATVEAMLAVVNQNLNDGDGQRDLALVLARILLRHTTSNEWQKVWPQIRDNSKFACEVIESLASNDTFPGVLACLPEAEIADFFLWYYPNYPPNEDPQPSPDDDLMHEVTTRHELGYLRGKIVGLLEQKGTSEAVSEIERIVRTLPNDPWLAFTLQLTRQATRFRSWNPPTPAELLELGRNAEARLVASAGQLLDVVIESLERLQKDMGDEGSAAQFLWDTRSRRPKEEEAISDFLYYHLKRDLGRYGPIVSREVQIRRRLMGGQEGERADIHVDVQVPAPSGVGLVPARVIIEVKGDWNPEVPTAMQEQLVDRYLEDNSCQHGLYVVVWMKLRPSSTTRRGRPPMTTLNSLKMDLAAQARSLSNPMRRVEAFVLDASI
ncbi:NACHT domain-containing protein [Armatimonas sp.]|uniref:NACHT domain-containing protein n=1 Tax=Armatimonas sp. TaxID=1872638 RepID=UPI00374CC386